MCLAIPMKIISVKGEFAEVQSGGLRRKANVAMLAGLKPGDYIMVHAGFAIQKLDPEKARETLRIIDEIR
ncbi:MAG: HypC/HybG/HupF family hydrogenase formation chaperone [Candidatus Omnitrophica bacterium]|jgi:hydrogenase expression/formation protein HypC|nr:HypC/HybG/HupF family hydrogenase formation chaperone [Candidatus Omnitrophota bacterium]MDD5512178.1 HypC/HybG/HupF family hydrogenase formation chaperone [Candidatus Omnitrophota bacterium]